MMRLILGAALVGALTTCARRVDVDVMVQERTGPEAILMPRRAEGATLRVASFNILYAGRREHPWENRRDSVVACIRDMNPDVFGVQEALWSQLEDLIEALPAYTCVGRGRDDGHRAGEFMAVFYRTDRFVLGFSETFWLSDTPEVPGSNTWGAACNRVATVAILIDRTDGSQFGICNTHLDHRSENAREKGSALIRRRLPTYGEDLAWVVTGDFNAQPGSTPHENLVGPQGQVKLIDTFAAVHSGQSAKTFHGYRPVRTLWGGRIDWILVTRAFQPLAAGVCQFKYHGTYPSDHFPVWADLRRADEEAGDGS